MDYERNRGGVVRFDISELTRGWAAGTIANNGLLIATKDVDAVTLGEQVAGMRLTVRYGFLPWSE